MTTDDIAAQSLDDNGDITAFASAWETWLGPSHSGRYPATVLPDDTNVHGPQPYEDAKRTYHCGWQGCTKSYSSLSTLNAHIRVQRHGDTRTANDFKEVRKQRRKNVSYAASIRKTMRLEAECLPEDSAHSSTSSTDVSLSLEIPGPGTLSLQNIVETFALPVADLTTSVYEVSKRALKFGGLSDVYTGMLETPRGQMKVALKVIRGVIVGPSGEKLTKMLLREISVWQTLEHENVQRLLGLCWDISEGVPAMVSEWLPHGDINDYLKPQRSGPCSILQSVIFDLLTQVWSGLQYLHQRNVVHADIKGANVLITNDHRARISDFGFSKLLEGTEMKSVSEHSTLSGTCRWMAPEIVDDSLPHSKASDIWACGCLILEVLSGDVPYRTKPTSTSVIIALARKERPPRPEGVNDAYWRLSQACCAIEPEQRPCIEEVYMRMDSCRGESEQ